VYETSKYSRDKTLDVDKFHQKEMRKITINTIIFLKACYPQNKKINFVTFHNELMWGVNSNNHREVDYEELARTID